MVERFAHLIGGLREGELSRAERVELVSLLRTSESLRQAAARDRLVDRLLRESRKAPMNADLVLRALPQGMSDLSAATMARLTTSDEEAARRRKGLGEQIASLWQQLRPSQRWALASVAIVVLVLSPALTSLWPSHPKPILIGQTTTVTGEPLVRQGKTLQPLRASGRIAFGDRIETSDADQAEIRFIDGTTVGLGFNTTVEIPAPASGPESEVRNPQAPWARPPQLNLVRGQIWTKVQKTTNGPAARYAVSTPVATAVARGTEFGVKLKGAAGLLPAGASGLTASNLTAVLTVKEGAVDFSNSFGSVQATAMTESTADGHTRPTEPRRLQSIQTVSLGMGEHRSLLVSSALTPWEAGEKLAGGGGFAGLQLHNAPGSPSVPASGSPAAEVRVAQVQTGSPAARAGLHPGVVILAVDGQPITNALQVTRTIRLRPNSSMTLTVASGGQQRLVPLSVTYKTNEVRGPALAPESAARLTALMQRWLQDGSATEGERLSQARGMGGSNTLRAAACNNLGVFYELEDAYGPAIRAYGQAVYIDPNVPLYRRNLGVALRNIGSFERAAEELHAAWRLVPNSIAAQQSYADILSLLGNNEEALKMTDTALAADPQHHGLWELKERILTQQGRLIEATEAARQAVETEPGCAVARGYLGGALVREGKLVEAEEGYRKEARKNNMSNKIASR